MLSTKDCTAINLIALVVIEPVFAGRHSVKNCIHVVYLLFNTSIYLFKMGNLFKDFKNHLEKSMNM